MKFNVDTPIEMIQDWLIKMEKNSVYDHKKRTSFLYEEIEEFKESNNEIEQIDALVDITWFAVGSIALIKEVFSNSIQNIRYDKNSFNLNETYDKDKLYSELYGLYLLVNNSKTEIEITTNLSLLIRSCFKNIHLLNYRVNDPFRIVYDSNMTKVIKTKSGDTLQKEVEVYGSNNVKLEIIDTDMYIIRRNIDNKILKPTTYQKPNWSKLNKIK